MMMMMMVATQLNYCTQVLPQRLDLRLALQLGIGLKSTATEAQKPLSLPGSGLVITLDSLKIPAANETLMQKYSECGGW